MHILYRKTVDLSIGFRDFWIIIQRFLTYNGIFVHYLCIFIHTDCIYTSFMQPMLQINTCLRRFAFRNLLRSSAGNYGSASVAALRSHINNVICNLNNVHIVLYDDYGISCLTKSLKYVDKSCNVCGMKPRSGLIKYIHRLSCSLSGKLGCKLNALCLASGKGSR